MRCITLTFLAAGLALAAPAQAQTLQQNVPEDAIQIMRKAICSLNDGETVIYWWSGSMFSRVEGERDRRLFDLQGMNIRQCLTVNDPERGPGFRSVSREIMLHLDPETGEVQDNWINPWTGEELAVMHVANDPVNMRNSIHAYRADGTPLTTDYLLLNGRAIDTGNTPLFYENPMGGDYQEWVGGTYHAMEMGNNFFYIDDLFNGSDPTVDHHSISWSRVSGWLPWMRMGDRNGMIYTATVGGRAESIDDLPEPLRSTLRDRYPAYNAPPPLDDTRPNQTSWEVFKLMMDEQAEENVE